MPGNSDAVVTLYDNIKLHVRRFTNGADKRFKLIPGDVGRPLGDITSDLLYPGMIDEAREVPRTLETELREEIARRKSRLGSEG